MLSASVHGLVSSADVGEVCAKAGLKYSAANPSGNKNLRIEFSR
jgi:hypothetical protein